MKVNIMIYVKNLLSYKLTKIIKESDEMKGITKNYDTIKRIKRRKKSQEKSRK